MLAYGKLMVFIGFPGSTCHICHMPWPYTLFQSFRFGAFGIWCLDFFLKTCNDLSTLAVIKSGSLSRRFPNSYSTIVYWFLLYPFLCIYIYLYNYIYNYINIYIYTDTYNITQNHASFESWTKTNMLVEWWTWLEWFIHRVFEVKRVAARCCAWLLTSKKDMFSWKMPFVCNSITSHQ